MKFHSHASGTVRLRRSDSSQVARNSASRQPCAPKKRVPSAGANRNGAFPAATARPHVLAIILSSRGEARSISHHWNGGGGGGAAPPGPPPSAAGGMRSPPGPPSTCPAATPPLADKARRRAPPARATAAASRGPPRR